MRIFRPTRRSKKHGISFRDYTPKSPNRESMTVLLLARGYDRDRLNAMPKVSLENLYAMYAGQRQNGHGLRPMGKLPIDRHLHRMGM